MHRTINHGWPLNGHRVYYAALYGVNKMSIKFMLSAEVEPPYMQTLEALIEDKIYVVAEFVDINKIEEKTIKRIKSLPGAFDALLSVRKKHSDAIARFIADGEDNEN